MSDGAFPGLTDIHAHPAMNAFLWDRDLRRHHFGGDAFDPLASLSDFVMLSKGGVKVLWSSLHVPEQAFLDSPPIHLAAHSTKGGRMLLEENAWECLLAEMGEMEAQVERSSEHFRHVRSNAELDAALAAGRTAIVHTVEGGHVLSAGLAEDDVAGRLARVDALADRGVASITLAHLFPNDLAGHVDAIPKEEHRILFWRVDPQVDLARGLTDLGRAVLERMVERRILPDVAHCTVPARQQIYAQVAGRVPIVASHVGVSTLNPEPYNLTQEDVEAIAASRGLIGVIFMPYWLEASHPKDGLDAIWRTMVQIDDWAGGGWEHVAVGTDFDGFTDPPDDCSDESQLPKLRTHLEQQGLAADAIDRVLGGNARRVLADGWR
jgi:microsomal dipeptidase-like Zn-dependent dipeptidase